MLKGLHLSRLVTALVLPGTIEAIHQCGDDAGDGGDNGCDPARVVFGGFFGLEDERAKKVACTLVVRYSGGKGNSVHLPRQ